MKLWSILKSVGGAAIQTALPGTGSLIVGAINELLPKGEALPPGASGEDITRVIADLPPEQQADLMDREFEVDIVQIKESNDTVRAMLESDAKNQHSTRPRIALGAFRAVAFVIVLTVSAWVYGVIRGDDALVEHLVNGWPFILTAIGPLVTLLWAYFGILKQEHKNRLDAANGAAGSSGVVGVLANLLTRR